MILTIEFTAAHIHLIEEEVNAKSIVIKRFIEIPTPDGSYLNGIVVNTAVVAAAIQVAVKEHHIRSKKVIVAVSSGDILRKEFHIPHGKAKHTRGMVENELNRAGMLKPEYIFDYIVKTDTNPEAQPSEMQSVDVYLMPKALANNYLTAIRRAGLIASRIEGFNSSMERLARLLGVDQDEDMTILCCAELEQIGLVFAGADNKMIYRSAMIKPEEAIEENSFIVSAVQSLTNGRDPSEIVFEEIIENVSKLVQFHSQSGKGNRVSQILMYGDLSKDQSLLERIEQVSGIATRRCPIPKCVTSTAGEEITCLNLIGASAAGMPGLGEENMLQFFQLIRGNSQGKTTKKDLIPLAVGMGIVFILAGVYCVQALKNSSVEASSSTMLDFIAEPENLVNYQKAKELKERTEMLRAYNEVCGQYIDVIKENRRLEASDFSIFAELKPDDVTIDSYIFKIDTMTLSCTTTTPEGASNFAKILSDSGNYEEVKYNGFSGGMTDEGAGTYSFSLVCKLWQQRGGES